MLACVTCTLRMQESQQPKGCPGQVLNHGSLHAYIIRWRIPSTCRSMPSLSVVHEVAMHLNFVPAHSLCGLHEIACMKGQVPAHSLRACARLVHVACLRLVHRRCQIDIAACKVSLCGFPPKCCASVACLLSATPKHSLFDVCLQSVPQNCAPVVCLCMMHETACIAGCCRAMCRGAAANGMLAAAHKSVGQRLRCKQNPVQTQQDWLFTQAQQHT
jgi:hypothetical protein